jgi:isoquinoline 1-oxidoreductase alpha subunit
MAAFTINGESVSVDVSSDTPLLWVIRDHLQMTGTKFGCGMAQCGACTVLLDGQATRSCVMPVAAVEGKDITTIEGLGGEHPLQKAWVRNNVPQCGYCQSGQIMSAVALLNDNPNPTEEEIKTAMSGNICRCGCYQRIHRSIAEAAEDMPQVAFYDATQTGGAA